MDLHRLEALLQLVHERVEHVTHEHLHDQLALLLQDAVADVHSVHAEVDRPGMVHGVMTGDVGRHVREDDVSLAAEPVHELDHGGVVGYVAHEGLDPLDGLDVPEVHADDLAVRPRALLRYLTPTARARPQVDDRVAGLEDAEALVDLDQLEGCPGTVVQLLGELVVVLVPPLRDPAVVQVCHEVCYRHRL